MAIQQQLDSAAQQQRDQMEALLGRGRTNKHMKIKKIGHCCLIIETKGVRIMTDPGSFTTEQDQEKNIDIIVISHEHGDHFHVESVKNVVANNPDATIITNSAVGKLLDAEGIAYEVLEHGHSLTVKNISFEAFGERHAVIYKEMGQVLNTGYFIDGALFYPGDAFTDPRLNDSVGQAQRPIEILALPTAGPWMKLSEAIEYALLMKPRQAFPVHDAIMKNPGMMNPWVAGLLEKEGIHFVPLNAGEEHTFS